MPYTPEELQNLPWYQNLIDEDEQNFLVSSICPKNRLLGSIFMKTEDIGTDEDVVAGEVPVDTEESLSLLILMRGQNVPKLVGNKCLIILI